MSMLEQHGNMRTKTKEMTANSYRKKQSKYLLFVKSIASTSAKSHKDMVQDACRDLKGYLSSVECFHQVFHLC